MEQERIRIPAQGAGKYPLIHRTPLTNLRIFAGINIYDGVNAMTTLRRPVLNDKAGCVSGIELYVDGGVAPNLTRQDHAVAQANLIASQPIASYGNRQMRGVKNEPHYKNLD